MTASTQPSAPDINATVMASAGSGKTWQLITRIVRLLLAGNPPDTILAITFTRKAAAEILSRLDARLLELAVMDEDDLQLALQSLEITPDSHTLARARTLYEELLSLPHTVKTTTFHAFCQDILRSFPIEADVPPGFELLEKTGVLRQEAWAALFSEATQQPDSTLAISLEQMFELCSGLHNTQSLLTAFLDHRSDWWMYTADQTAPVDYACSTLRERLEIHADDAPLARFPDGALTALIQEFCSLLAKHLKPGKNQQHLDDLTGVLNDHLPPEQAYTLVQHAFFTAEGAPYKRKHSKVQAEAMGVEGEARFLALHDAICQQLDQVQDHLYRLATYTLSCAWFITGSRLLAHYQRIKAERRQLDFADLEWKAYRLLSHADNTHWIQYKLDQRINHLLVDEFQDTNPIQWQLLLPLLEELGAGDPERRRSVFLVGDSKQSIYRFRRAEPRLFGQAQAWMQEHLGALSFPLSTSWRSSPAVISFVNRLFTSEALAGRLDPFETHTTHRDHWGEVTLLPLSKASGKEAAAPPAGLRNPLEIPRPLQPDRRHYQEGQAIADAITTLLDSRQVVDDNNQARAVRYGDIMILLRNRTHVHEYERALQERGIPYLGADRGTLLETLEIHDMVALLETLVTPYNNLSLATVLRSPLFDCDDRDLIELARLSGESYWIDRLTLVAASQPPGSPLARAAHWLGHWRNLAGQLPVHDLLDRIYCEGDVLYRYQSAFPEHMQHRVYANLLRFLELALEIDSGRYPSLVQFIARLEELREHAQEAPDEAMTLGNSDDRVRLMTIHAAKGLESAVVFLADATASGKTTESYRPIIDWPVSSPRPASIHLSSKPIDSYTRRLLDQELAADRVEETNLLYVAVTRAKQYLYISGCRPTKGRELGWYGAIASGYHIDPESIDAATVLETAGTSPTTVTTLETKEPGPIPDIDPRLGSIISITPLVQEIAPSRAAGDPNIPHEILDEDGRTRGLIIHRMLQLCSMHGAGLSSATLLLQIASEFGLKPGDALLQACWQEVAELYQQAALQSLFDPTRYQTAYNEVPLQYRRGAQTVTGVIDRLVISASQIHLIDYKTHHVTERETLDSLAQSYYPQMQLYAEGVRRLWPGRTLQAALLFTHTGYLHPCPL